MFGGFHRVNGEVKHVPDCTCLTCDRDIHHLGIMSHRAMHRRKGEDCRIAFSDGRVEAYKFSESK